MAIDTRRLREEAIGSDLVVSIFGVTMACTTSYRVRRLVQVKSVAEEEEPWTADARGLGILPLQK
jgi:hypothetical protein